MAADDQPAAAHRRQEARDGADGDIDTDQRRIDAEIGDDGGGDQRHRRAAQRREGLLHRHRAEREVEIEDVTAPGSTTGSSVLAPHPAAPQGTCHAHVSKRLVHATTLSRMAFRPHPDPQRRNEHA